MRFCDDYPELPLEALIGLFGKLLAPPIAPLTLLTAEHYKMEIQNALHATFPSHKPECLGKILPLFSSHGQVFPRLVYGEFESKIEFMDKSSIGSLLTINSCTPCFVSWTMIDPGQSIEQMFSCFAQV